MKNCTYNCPICGEHRFTQNGDFSICPHCGWINDKVMNDDPSYWGGANKLCQLDYRLRYQYYISRNPKYHWAHDKFPEVPQIEEMDCPVCKKMRFVPLRWDEIYCGVFPSDIHCQFCGWNYDVEQTENPNRRNGANEMSLNEYRRWYAEKIAENPEYSYFEEITEKYIPTPHKCPVCGKFTFKDEASFDTCPFCGWEDDEVQTNDPYYTGGANTISLNEYKAQYIEKIKLNPKYRYDKK